MYANNGKANTIHFTPYENKAKVENHLIISLIFDVNYVIKLSKV